MSNTEMMHSAVLFDTLAYAKKLKGAGFTEAQAEIQAEALAEIIEQRLSTKEDVMELKRDLKEMEQRIIIKLGAMVAASIAITVSLMKIL